MLSIRITKRNDGGGLLHCTRADGSVTWQKQSPLQAPHFGLHDLTHYAVESTLELRGFYRLIADGWDIEDTTGKGSRGALPPEALEVEALVGTLDSERAGGVAWSATDFNECAAMQASASGRPAPRPVTDEQLSRIREARGALFEQWRTVGQGAWLDLQFF
jgi:hypothetical protein